MMNLEEARRWKALEQRARERGWTIDSLEGASHRPEASAAGQFALMQLAAPAGPLATGNLDAIEAFLKSSGL
ncbi:MAG TPA: hypothetical protein VMQ73_10365 [Methylomirabilota bacterium]|nr:hypothetical protein [Methylomirabilota bacterium]